jgi:outer membrane protein TolC
MPSRLLVALLAATLVSACSLAPEYRVPAVPVADAYQGAGPWSPAQPGQALPHDGWWRVYQDAQLDTLQQRLLVNNADLAAALAHYQQAQAFVDAASADL